MKPLNAPSLCYKLEPPKVNCYHSGEEADAASFAWDPPWDPLGGKCVQIAWQCTPCAQKWPWRELQRTSTGTIRCVLCSFDRTMPRTEVAAERVALSLVCQSANTCGL